MILGIPVISGQPHGADFIAATNFHKSSPFCHVTFFFGAIQHATSFSHWIYSEFCSASTCFGMAEIPTADVGRCRSMLILWQERDLFELGERDRFAEAPSIMGVQAGSGR